RDDRRSQRAAAGRQGAASHPRLLRSSSAPARWLSSPFVVAGPGFGVPALFGALVLIEAGVPLPIPGDVLMLLVGERAAAGALPARRALPLLVLGGSLFIQLHLVLGFYIGRVAEQAFKRAALPTLIVISVLAVLGVAFWLIRRGRRVGAHAWAEATCPACLML